MIAAAAMVAATMLGTSSKMDYLPLGNVRTDMVTNPTGLSAHVHTFYGADASLRPDTSYKEIRAACGNSGNVDDNKSLYWHPTIYKRNPNAGTYEAAPISFASAYYIWQTGKTQAFPDGFQMIARQSSGGKARVKFDCNGPSACERTDGGCTVPKPCPLIKKEDGSEGYACLPQKQCAELEIKIVFPSCWDGKSLTSDDFMSHMAYAAGDWGKYGVDDRQWRAYDAECPKSHPVRVPEIQFYFRINNYEGGHHVFSDGGSEVHADYFSGWEKAALQKVLDQCENESEAASSDAWCESHFKFRDMPKKKGDERIVAKLRELQPKNKRDYTKTIAAEAVTGISKLPNPASPSTLIESTTNWTASPQCGLLGDKDGNGCTAEDADACTSSAVRGRRSLWLAGTTAGVLATLNIP